VKNKETTLAGSIKIVLGSIAIGFAFFIIAVVMLAILAPPETFSEFMNKGGFVWVIFSFLSYPISRKLLTRRSMDSGSIEKED